MTLRTISFCLLMTVCSALVAANLRALELRQDGNRPAVLFTLDKTVPHKVFTLAHPERIVVDFENTRLGINLNHVTAGSHFIKSVRSGHPHPGTLRLVFEVNSSIVNRMDNLQLKPIKHGFIMDLSQNNLAAKPLHSDPNLSTPSIKPKPMKAVSVRHEPKRNLRDVIVVIDAGHGGKDPGAVGPRRSQEKNVTLAIALKLKQIIDKQPGMRAVLTRQGDYYIELRDRLRIARKYNGDIFVSIHADAFINQQSNGASVFALSQSGATSEAARWLAEKENYSELGGVNLADLDDQSGLVRTVLIDLSQTATIGASVNMGERVLRNLDYITSLHNDKVEQARFMVLKSPDIPSILVETGFISNPREEQNLTSNTYQMKLSQAIFQGIKNYFWDYPPHGSRVEALVGNKGNSLVQARPVNPKVMGTYRVTASALPNKKVVKPKRYFGRSKT